MKLMVLTTDRSRLASYGTRCRTAWAAGRRGHAPGEQRYREDIGARELTERFGLSVDSAQLS